jgi:hypothetical protein
MRSWRNLKTLSGVCENLGAAVLQATFSKSANCLHGLRQAPLGKSLKKTEQEG